MGHELVFVGANPAALLWDGDQATAFVSVWQADWSVEGSGGAIVLCRPGELRVLCDTPLLGRWLFDTFVVHFSDLNHFEGPARPTVERAAVKVDIDLAAGLSASAADVTVHITGVLDRPDVGDRHPEELFPGVAVVVQGGVIDGQESQGVAVVHPHRRRVGVEQQAVARPEIRVVAGVQVQVGDAGQRAGVCVLHRRFPLEGFKAHVLSQKEAPGRSPARWLSGQPAGRGEARSFASPGFPGFAVSSGWLCCV